MIHESKIYNFQEHKESLQGSKGDELLSPLKLFRHKDLLDGIRSDKLVSKKKLLNTINLLHFMNGSILVHLSDPRYQEDFLVYCRIESCTEQEIRCVWPEDAAPVTEKGRPLNLIVEDGLSLLVLPIRVTGFDDKGFSAQMPEKGYLMGKRCARRNVCRDVNATMKQNSFQAKGELIDFNATAFRVRLTPNPSASFNWMNFNEPFSICLQKNEQVIFSGPCRCVRQAGDLRGRELVLAPLHQKIQRYRKQKLRTNRLHLSPPPFIRFEHPCSGQIIQRDILDLTYTGFSIEEQGEDAVFMPGMVIPDLEICQDGIKGVFCTAQVIYRKELEKGRVCCGLAILDMNFRAYRHLSHLLLHAEDPQARFTCEMEMNALWEFFFNTGFIYPKKYHLIEKSREAFKDTYSKLYCEDQEIEAHFTLQENNRVYGHVSMLRSYQRAWMVHHLAARSLRGKHRGLTIVKSILKFFDGLCRYPSIGFDYMIFYFRPDNFFPNLLFGGFARDFGNPQAASMDLFACLTHPKDNPQTPLLPGWKIEDFGTRHFPELETFYRNSSGGLFLDVLRLNQTDEGHESLEDAYRRCGLFRQWRTYALVHEQKLKAAFVVNRSSSGLNLAELLNSITVIVTDPVNLPRTVLNTALDRLSTVYDDLASVPLLIYPATYTGEKVEKQYLLWILDTRYGKEYREYMDKKTKINLGFLLKHLFRKIVSK